MAGRPRAGAPPDLVAAPLLHGLDAPPIDASIELLTLPAAELAARFDAGELDLALLPASAIAERVARVGVVPGLAVTSDGSSDARLHLRVPLESVTRVVSTAPGHAAEMLVVTLFAGSGRSIEIERWSGGVEGALAAQGAVLLAGDDALRWSAPPAARELDLGAAWTDLTGLPFVWWAWVVRSDQVGRGTYSLLHSARLRGRRSLDAIAARTVVESRSRRAALGQLHQMVYRLGRREVAGFEMFRDAARDAGLPLPAAPLTLLRPRSVAACRDHLGRRNVTR